MPARVRTFLARLRRRNVFKVTAVYAATAFVVWQAVEIAFPRLGLPDWSVTLVVVLSLVGLPVAVVLAWADELTPEGVARAAPQAKDTGLETHHEPVLPAANSLAVLPLRALGSDPEGEFFAEGITEDIISYLARIRGLKVISRTSSMQFRDSELGTVQIAAQLGVRNILEGSVRRQGGSLRVSTHLIDARTDQHLWAETFDRPWADVFAVQSEIAESVAEALHVSLSHGERTALDQAPTEDLEAYRCVLEARRRYDVRFAIPESIAFYKEATKRDPDYGDAFAGLAQTITYDANGYWGSRPRDVVPNAIEAAKRALELNPQHAEAMATLGFIEYVHNLDIERGCTLLREAIDLGQSSSVPFFNHAAVMFMMGQHEESLASFDRAIEYDPLSVVLHVNYAMALHFSGRHEEVVGKVTRSREVFGPGLLGLPQGLALVELGRGVEALPHFQEVVDSNPEWPFGLQTLAYGFVCAGQVEKGLGLMHELEHREGEEYLVPLGFALVHCAAGNDEAALQRLEQSFDERAGLPLMRLPAFRRLRANRRYSSILDRMAGRLE